MVLLEKLKIQGWYLTEEGLRKLTTANNLQAEDVNKIISLAINWDLKDIAAGALPVKSDSNGNISGRIVLQIQKMRNISAPKANEESTVAPRFLQLELSDGSSTIGALEFERIPSLNLNLPPGTKIFLKADKLQLLHGFLVLKPSEVQVLGGRVEQLAEKWEVAKQMLKYARSNRRISGTGGPPPWIAFGKRLDAHKDSLPADRNFKSLQAASEKDKNSKENEEFNASRNQAIAEATKAGQKKIFGGGQQNILDHNVKKILEKGYTEEEAKYALKTTNNNLERALYNLKRRNNNRGDLLENRTKSAVPSNGGRGREKGGIASAKEEASSAKPQTNVCLFDFLTDKLPVSTSNSNVTLQVVSNHEQNLKESSKVVNNKYKASCTATNKFENNMSSSFAANRAINTLMRDSKTLLRSNANNTKNTQVDRKLPLNNKNDASLERTNSNKMQLQHKNVDKLTSQPSPILEENKNFMGNNNRRADRPIKNESEKILKHSSGDLQGIKPSNECKISDNKTYQSREKNRNSTNNYQSQQKQKNKDNNYEKEFDNLVESTAKINISQGRNKNQRNFQSGNQQQILTSKPKLLEQNTSHNYNKKPFIDSQIFSSKSVQQNQKSMGYIDQPGGGFAYDHSKIVGFQSKEANEYAMNLLKSQGLTMPQMVQPQSQQITSLPPSAPTQQQHLSAQTLNPQTTPTVAYMTQNSNMFIAPSQQAPSQFNMMSSVNWPWKIGDLCLAKYWDDGNYYNAKITAISEKTCVVLFLGYGNHEEVLRSDCLPITDAQHIPMNTYQANPPMQQSPSSFQQRNNIQSGGLSSGVGNNQRYRGERQMYIPPNKRGNN